MKKPSKKPIEVKEDCYLIDIDIKYTPEDLRDIANRMEQNNISSIIMEYYGYDGGIDFYQYRMESPIEAEVRYTKEMKKYEKWKADEKIRKEKQREKIIKEAKKLGLTVTE